MFELMARAVRGPERPPSPARLGGLRSAGSAGRPQRGRLHRGHRRVGAQRRAPADRRVHAARQRDGGRAPRDAAACRRSIAFTSRPIRSRCCNSRSSSARSASRWARPEGGVKPMHFQKLVGEDPRQSGRAADRVPDAADHAEGALRPDERRALRAGRGDLHALHVADPPLSRSGRASVAARAAADQGQRRAEGGARRGSAGGRPPHLRDGAARRRGRARDPAVEEGPLHGRQGRRRVRRLHHRRRAVRDVRRADRSLRRRPRPRHARWRTTTTGSASSRTRCSARTPRRPIGSAIACACRSSASTWNGGRSISASRTSWRRSGATNGRAVRRAAAHARRKISARGRRNSVASAKQRLGKNERKGQAVTNLVVGTAGHIDHGKSSLVQGADRDRSRSPQGRKSARHHHRARVRAHHDRRHARRVCRRARARAVRAHDAGRGRRDRLRAADRRGRRIGDAADARALRHLPPPAHSARHRRADEIGSGRCRHARAGPAGCRASS